MTQKNVDKKKKKKNFKVKLMPKIFHATKIII